MVRIWASWHYSQGQRKKLTLLDVCSRFWLLSTNDLLSFILQVWRNAFRYFLLLLFISCCSTLYCPRDHTLVPLSCCSQGSTWFAVLLGSFSFSFKCSWMFFLIGSVTLQPNITCFLPSVLLLSQAVVQKTKFVLQYHKYTWLITSHIFPPFKITSWRKRYKYTVKLN